MCVDVSLCFRFWKSITHTVWIVDTSKLLYLACNTTVQVRAIILKQFSLGFVFCLLLEKSFEFFFVEKTLFVKNIQKKSWTIKNDF